jgi:hypothetical protein
MALEGALAAMGFLRALGLGAPSASGLSPGLSLAFSAPDPGCRPPHAHTFTLRR